MIGKRTLASALAGTLVLAAPATADVPSLRKQGTATQLIVSGKPYLIIGGELSNSAASSADYMAPHWARLKAMNLNTVLAPVSWELVEPVEGRYDWSSLDSMIKAARANDLKLVILWFGAWKNSMSTYVPAWVKRDQARFPRAAGPDGQGLDILSPFGAETLRADQRVYAALLEHLKAVDSRDATVLMIQAENEIGMLPTARDYGPTATAAFQQDVPPDLIAYLNEHRATLVPQMKAMWLERGARMHGTWEQVFGPGDAAAEVFTAWHYARFVESLVSAGKDRYPLPMYVNVALNRPGRRPGEYPSGGPLPHLIDVWKAGAPSVDLLAPDIYFANFTDIVQLYHRTDNPLFVPEGHNADNPVPANAFYALGAQDAIGFSPFSIDSIDTEPGALKDAYGVLQQLRPYILAAQGSDRIAGFKPHQAYDDTLDYAPQEKSIGDYRFTVSFTDDIQKPVMTANTAGYGGIIIQTGPQEYLIAGQGFTVTFKPVGNGPALAGIESAFEGVFDAGGRWRPGRLLNGDQTHQGRHIRLAAGEWQIQRVKLYRY